ncbi:TMEM14 family protein [Crocosphaera sp. UHCC 0190]|uniref:TMEM14 family protein n=1 Tax=Crocosphaera sp. UHCC 0190 TaxID=3110246 RepID=UPI002B211A95|nr:TMEM14 family protein [Crocosphaera sp. UHCC 0190]MEA5510136.1 TMEM14 family protein [Crocosphaera sp. UHCC 0190]
MNLTVLAAFLYGIILLVGGIIGYAKAKSKPSLISGVVTGLLLISAAIIQLQNISWGLTLAQITTILLIVVFAIRFIKTRKWMPGGLMLILSVATLAILVSPA